ncbi:hypothetical protein LXA43DRAFT_899759 [Ganoderma leucocontextum]|nr:hypothetical protein LXA43DRAFT_899759 [Ganoderma leucocontextum]
MESYWEAGIGETHVSDHGGQLHGAVVALDCKSFATHEFCSLWRRGTPIVVQNVHADLQGRWTPADFIQEYGSRSVELVNCVTGNTRRSSVSDFFSLMNAPESRLSIMKLKDWPPQKHFRKEFPQLFEAFSLGSPCPDVTRYNGILNLASHYPVNSAVVPDLGPKMYVALASPLDDDRYGTTNLHIDVTDAINILVWSSGTPSDSAAIWDIIPFEALRALREFIQDKGLYTGAGDPIHAQAIFLTDEMIQQFTTHSKFPVWRIHQRLGDAVFIPAGCAHQVRNVCNATKVACDFISIENLARTHRVASELRLQRLVSRGDDVLQLHTVLWYAWCAATEAESTIGKD